MLARIRERDVSLFIFFFDAYLQRGAAIPEIFLCAASAERRVRAPRCASVGAKRHHFRGCERKLTSGPREGQAVGLDQSREEGVVCDVHGGALRGVKSWPNHGFLSAPLSVRRRSVI